MIKLCIFDLDGTLANTLTSISYFANKALNKHNLDSIPTERYKKLVGNGAAVLVQRMIKEVGGSKQDYLKVLPEYNTSYDNNFLYLTAPYGGILNMLAALKAMGTKTAVLSNKPESTTKKISDTLFGERLIDLCCGAREDFPLKPDPKGVFEILEHFNISEEQCLYIGDTATDIETAKNAGLKAIGVLWGFRDLNELSAAGADFIVSTPSEIVKIAESFK